MGRASLGKEAGEDGGCEAMEWRVTAAKRRRRRRNIDSGDIIS